MLIQIARECYITQSSVNMAQVMSESQLPFRRNGEGGVWSRASSMGWRLCVCVVVVVGVGATTAKWCEIDMYLLLDTTRKSSVGSPTAPLCLTLSESERSNLRSLQY